MSLKIVQFPASDFRDIAAAARRFADAVEAGDYGEPGSAVLVVDAPDCVWIEHWGESVSNYQAIGILETGKQHLLNQIIPD
jgi:hypothetical protein